MLVVMVALIFHHHDHDHDCGSCPICHLVKQIGLAFVAGLIFFAVLIVKSFFIPVCEQFQNLIFSFSLQTRAPPVTHS